MAESQELILKGKRESAAKKALDGGKGETDPNSDLLTPLSRDPIPGISVTNEEAIKQNSEEAIKQEEEAKRLAIEERQHLKYPGIDDHVSTPGYAERLKLAREVRELVDWAGAQKEPPPHPFKTWGRYMSEMHWNRMRAAHPDLWDERFPK